jgi:hypothetical protein
MTIFNDSKYTRWYYAIINTRLANPVAEDSYSESHHIIPESFYIERIREGPAGWLEGDPESLDNKVSLTGREHGLCHWLLTKMTEGVSLIKCQQAFDMMGIGASQQERGMSRLTCRAYERNRIEIAIIRSDRMKLVNPMNDPAARAKVGDSKRGKKRVGVFTEEQKRQMCIDRAGDGNGMYGKTHKQSTVELLSHLASLRTYSEETNEKRRVASGGRKEITDGTVYKKVKLDELQYWLDKGWIVKGKSRRKKSKA